MTSIEVGTDEVGTDRLILFYGAGSGLGKSTLAAGLTAQLLQSGKKARLVEEHDIYTIQVFEPYVQRVQQGYADDAVTLALCCKRYVQQLEECLPETAVLDSILPCWDWLLSADCALDAVVRFSDELQKQLAKLNPLLVIVEGDYDRALARAIAERGETWVLDQAEARTGERCIGAFRDYQKQLRVAMEPLWASWRYEYVCVNTTDQGIEKSLQTLLNAL